MGVQPACDVALLPGPTANALEIVEIDGEQTFESAGQLRLTTVAVDNDLDFLEWVEARFSSVSETVDRDTLYPPGRSEEEVAEQNEVLMANSQIDATVAGLIAAGYETENLYGGARIVDIADEAVEAVGERSPGDQIVVELADGREVELVAIEHPDDPSRALLGLLLEHVVDLPFEVAIDAGNIGGPSAGLMFALGIVDLLGAEDLTAGATIAGTGTITFDGEVGSIGGIRQKVVGATSPIDEDAEPADVFLVPAGNMTEARSASVSRDVLLVPVATIDEAITALTRLADGDEPAGAVALGP